MLRCKLHFETVKLRLRQPFTIARGTKETVTNTFVKLNSNDGFTGYGEAAPNSRYGEDARSVEAYLDGLPEDFFDGIEEENDLVERLDAYEASESPGPVRAARAAVEMAWLDIYAKREGQPLWKLWGYSSATGPATSYTIGLDEIGVMQQKVRDAEAYPVLKVKLGTSRDREIIRELREVTDKPIRVDANEGWGSPQEALEMIRFLSDHTIELVEQPLPANRTEEMAGLKKASPLPLCADESFMGEQSLDAMAGTFDIVNIKLMKIGSMVKARQVMKKARGLGLQVMIGCMIESSVANTAGAVLALEADYADLDGHLLIADDPARGLRLDAGKRIVLGDKPGLGVTMG